MRYVTYSSPSGPRAAVVTAEGYRDLAEADNDLPSSLRQLLESGADGQRRAEAAARRGRPFRPESVKLLAPIPDPQKVICVGLNYRDHAQESGREPPDEPVIFSKFATAVRGQDDPIELPSNSQEVDYEAELVAVIGAGGRNIPENRALAHVAGFCCGNDVSARDWQHRKPGGQWLLGKSFDSFAPMGPELVTNDEVAGGANLAIRLRLNGQVMQDSNTSGLIFSVSRLVAYVSSVCSLSPGDVIFTGTPAGVGAARKPPVFLKAGDVVEVEIGALGTLRNSVVSSGL